MSFFCTLITFFIKFEGSDEVHGVGCREQPCLMVAPPIFDDEDAYGLFVHLYMQ